MKPLSKSGWTLVAITAVLGVAATALRLWISIHMGTNQVLSTSLSFLLGCCTLAATAFIPTRWPARHTILLFAGTIALSLLLTVLPISRVAQDYITLFFPAAFSFWLCYWRDGGVRGLTWTLFGELALVCLCLADDNELGLACVLVTGLVLGSLAARSDHFAIGRRKTGVIVAISTVVTFTITNIRLFYADFFQYFQMAVLHPELEPRGRGCLALTVRQILGQARLAGNGFWDPELFPWSFVNTLPQWGGRNLLTTMIFYGGWLPFLVVVLLAIGVITWILCRGLSQRWRPARYHAIAITITLLADVLFSVLWNLGVPVAAADFPMLSGGASMICTMTLVGMHLSVCRDAKKES